MTVHNHGNHSSPVYDGRPNDYLITTGASRTYTYEHLEDGGDERGAPQFYHDHRMDLTARNVWMGLAGFYILDDPADPSTLPSGQFDVPLAIADRQFDAGNQIPYVFNANGVLGDHILINGVYQPYLDVGDRKYRFRILDASNTRVYNLALTGGQSFTQIGTESGLLPAPVSRTEMRLGPGERLDVVIDFAGQLGQTLYLRDTRSNTDVLQFRVTQDLTDDSSIPATLRPVPDIGEPTVTRTFEFSRNAANRWAINGQIFEPDRVDAQPLWGSTEKWVLTNTSGAVHTVHLHGIDQQCLSRNGGACFPYETMKETWFLDAGETVEIKLKFSDHVGPYVFHCHVLEHEDDGMMAQFEVVSGDSDVDGWTDWQETYMGTDLGRACPLTPDPNDEVVDAWAPDANDTGNVDGFDVFLWAQRFGSTTALTPDRKLPYSARYDLNADGVIDGSDIFILAQYFNTSCI